MNWDYLLCLTLGIAIGTITSKRKVWTRRERLNRQVDLLNAN